MASTEYVQLYIYIIAIQQLFDNTLFEHDDG